MCAYGDGQDAASSSYTRQTFRDNACKQLSLGAQLLDEALQRTAIGVN
jgi:hypothetical protein